MAPRRGGGGFSSGSSSIGACSDAGAFESDYVKVLIAFVAFFFLVYSVQLYMLSKRKKDSKAGWGLLFSSVFLSWVSITMNIVVIPVQECAVIGARDSDSISIAISWISGISALLAVATLMLPILKLVTQSKIVTIVSSAYVVFLAVLWLATLAISTRLMLGDSYYYGYSRGLFDLARAQRGLIMARNVFMFLGCGFAGVVMVAQVLRKSHLKQGKTAVMLILMVLFALAYTLLDLAFYISAVYFGTNTNVASLVVTFLSYFFYAGFVGCAMAVIVSPNLTTDRKYPGHIPVAPPTYAPYGPSYQYVPQNA
ncbi:hypothetical protein FE257_007461 [Aspergillus nanangensis]|uniref:Uncharacterized protein n=1 Tax=Aspergillus nanangensis TaxID=2582783 RepID=A0AAD4CMU6_ASPNN|nr:hypothetical protein FE257_007461 [Aspergillus nanangensis]